MPSFAVQTPYTLYKGLSGKKKVVKPMLFNFETEAVRAMCMRGMLVPIDIVWANKDGIITKVYHNCPIQDQQKQYSSVTPAKYAIECAAGDAARLGLREGSQIRILRK
jgi:uncharacterized membrane protein (UPF0127 family)